MSKNKEGTFIVKVQLSLAGHEPGKRSMLIYSEDRSIQYEKTATPSEIFALGNQPKSYWKAKHRPDGVVQLLKPVPWQEW